MPDTDPAESAERTSAAEVTGVTQSGAGRRQLSRGIVIYQVLSRHFQGERSLLTLQTHCPFTFAFDSGERRACRRGRYAIEREYEREAKLGEGTYGVVYKARKIASQEVRSLAFEGASGRCQDVLRCS